MIIESSQNKIVKLVKSLDTKKGMDKHNAFIIEGENYLDAVPPDKILHTVLSESYKGEKQGVVVSDSIFKSLSDTVNPQGILTICEKMEYGLDVLDKANFIVALEELNDPGNLGTVIRTAKAAGVDVILASKNTVDIYNKKVVRATAGAIFTMPIIQNIQLDTVLQRLKNDGTKIICTHLKGNTEYYNVDLKQKICVVVGNEANGVSDGIASIADYLVKIPMADGVESLNASVATGVVLYEVVRQANCF